MSSSAIELALQTAENWKNATPSTDDTKTFLQQAIAGLDDPQQKADLTKNLENLAVTAVKTDEAFAKVTLFFEDFVKTSGSDFPGLANYLSQWKGHQSSWSTLVTQSRDLATETASNYQDYDAVMLNAIQEVTTKEDMVALAQDLETFSKQKPVQVSDDMSVKFAQLKSDVELFKSNFYSYLDEQKAKVDQEAKAAQEKIDQLKTTIDGLTAGIAAAIGLVGLGAWWNLILSAVAVVAAAAMAVARALAYKDLEKQQAILAEANRKQAALAHIKSDFDGLEPDFNLICGSLQLFSDIWAQFHQESLDFANELRQLPDATYPEVFKLRVQLARKIAEPLREGLRKYASSIHS